MNERISVLQSETTNDGLENQLESRYLIVNGTVYKYKAKEYNINESKERRLIILNASDLQM